MANSKKAKKGRHIFSEYLPSDHPIYRDGLQMIIVRSPRPPSKPRSEKEEKGEKKQGGKPKDLEHSP